MSRNRLSSKCPESGGDQESISMFDFTLIKKQALSRPKSEFPNNKVMASVALLGNSRFVGFNNFKTHPSMLKMCRDSSIESCSCNHAEVSALAKVPRQCRHKVELYVMRFLANGNVSMAKPCSRCEKYLQENDVDFRNVFYTDWNGEWVSLR